MMDDETEPWTCKTCTYINQPTFLSCGACATVKTQSKTALTAKLLEKTLEEKRRKKEKKLSSLLMSASSSSVPGPEIPTPPPLTPPDGTEASLDRLILLKAQLEKDERFRLADEKWKDKERWDSGLLEVERDKDPEDVAKLKKELETKEVELRGLKEELQSMTVEKKAKDELLSKKVAALQKALDKSENTTARVIHLVLDLLTDASPSTLSSLTVQLSSGSASSTSTEQATTTTPIPTTPTTPTITTTIPPSTPSTPSPSASAYTTTPSTPSAYTTTPAPTTPTTGTAVSFEVLKERLLSDAKKLKKEWNLQLEDELSKARSIEERDRERFQEIRECVVCMETNRTCVFQPCSHVAACLTCAKTLNECPVCNKTVTSFSRAFIW